MDNFVKTHHLETGAEATGHEARKLYLSGGPVLAMVKHAGYYAVKLSETGGMAGMSYYLCSEEPFSDAEKFFKACVKVANAAKASLQKGDN